MKIAQDRVNVLTSVEHMRSHAGACSEALYLNNPIVRNGIFALSSTVAAVFSFKMFRKKKKAESPKLSPEVGAARYFVTKLAASVLIPWLRNTLLDDACVSIRPKNK